MSFWALQSGELVFTGAGTIDTTTLTIGGASLPAGASFDIAPQAGSADTNAPAIAILRVGSFAVRGSGTVVVSGDHPLVVVAADTIDIAGTLDASAAASSNGPGITFGDADEGSAGGSDTNGGGAGGSFGSKGGDGGDGFCDGVCLPGSGGNADDPVSDDAQTLLYAGMGGGRSRSDISGSCNSSGGGAGGAIQLSAVTSVAISGTVVANGGGGGPGESCLGGNVSSGGGGGGSGGAIYLETRDGVVGVSGALAANGGAGGSGFDGAWGSDGTMSGVAVGAPSGSDSSGRGGDSGQDGETLQADDANGGGGGGGAGRIRIDSAASAEISGTIMPAPVL